MAFTYGLGGVEVVNCAGIGISYTKTTGVTYTIPPESLEQGVSFVQSVNSSKTHCGGSDVTTSEKLTINFDVLADITTIEYIIAILDKSFGNTSVDYLIISLDNGDTLTITNPIIMYFRKVKTNDVIKLNCQLELTAGDIDTVAVWSV